MFNLSSQDRDALIGFLQDLVCTPSLSTQEGEVAQRLAEEMLRVGFAEVTPDRIEWSRGIFDRSVDNLDMFRVIDLKLRRSFWDCLVGIGTVRLATKDDSDPTFDFYKVRQCRYLYDVIKKAGLVADRAQNVIHLE